MKNSIYLVLVSIVVVLFISGCSSNNTNIYSSTRGHNLGIRQSAITLERGAEVGFSSNMIKYDDRIASYTSYDTDNFGHPSSEYNEYYEKLLFTVVS